MEGGLLWQPSDRIRERARLTGYLRWLERRGRRFAGYPELWHWSVQSSGEFWDSLWEYFGILGERGAGPVTDGGPMPGVRWFPGASLNYARNALRHAADPDRADTCAVVFRSEAGDTRRITYAQLAAEVARVRSGLRALGVKPGDRVVGYLPNIPEALVAFLATASLGAIWSACPPDFGVTSVVDRFSQIEPTVLIAVDGYHYGGREYDRTQELGALRAALPTLRAIVLVPRPARTQMAGDLRWEEFGDPEAALDFVEVPFDHPLWVLYSSGTTGLPKPIVHGHGGIVLEHLKALAFHADLGPDDVFLWFTTTGWMMWNYLAGGLLAGATVVLYDGSPGHPDLDALWRLAADVGVTFFGTSAQFIAACGKAGLTPAAKHDLSRLRAVGSTGSPLPPEGYRWVYDKVGRNVLLGSISGGTDVCTAFVGATPLHPVRAGVIACRCLGAAVESYDEAGQPVTDIVGELVVTAPMPSMPVSFWNDPDGQRYRESYFDMYPDTWRHGDWLKVLPDGGCVIYGRSDATLNRGGVRMGTSDFYRIVEAFDEITDSLVVETGLLGRDGRLLLFVVLADNRDLDNDLVCRLNAAIRIYLSPRHVPDEVRAIPDIPRTLSGKKLEVPVRRILLGAPPDEVANRDAMLNPEALNYFFPETSVPSTRGLPVREVSVIAIERSRNQ
ncbi:acetoacetate--CoA ligase [Micromonospora echinofusca]|uniref:Acetoacetate--CoA ligase n=2 Tax=Micromonospora echinofusca TaxID=47858 RepID=A0ABS3VVI0_MICEH|nr:acetoacetate--CoA ligase [Micromonospora echinofusca]